MLPKKFSLRPRYLKGLSPLFHLGRALFPEAILGALPRDKRESAPEPLWRKVIEACKVSYVEPRGCVKPASVKYIIIHTTFQFTLSDNELDELKPTRRFLENQFE